MQQFLTARWITRYIFGSIVFGILLVVVVGFKLSADISFAVQAGTIAKDYQPVINWAQELRTSPFSPTAKSLSANEIDGLIPKLEKLAKTCSSTWLIKDKLPVDCETITETSELLIETEPFIKEHLESSHTYLILLQNSEELRASGGFMGSFARITVGSNGIENFEIQDIYEPDGQFKGYVPAPPGVFEYLSSGNGLRLPDANWAADFPSAAQTILAYFSFGKESSVDGLVAINSSLIEKMLAITGDIYLPDYDTNISADTFTQLARSNRDDFFPGSKQKQHFLGAFMTQLKIRFAELSQDQQHQLLNLVLDSITSKDTLFYSTNPSLQNYLVAQKATGSVSYPQQKTDAFLYLVESNVGINKANRAVERQVDLDLSDYQAVINLSFTNSNPSTPPAGSNDDNLNYANYQRVLVSPSWQLHSITIDGNELDSEKIDDNVITTKSGDQFRQVGFLTKTDAQSSTTIQVRFSKLAENIQAESQTVFIQKQPGQKPTPYQIKWRTAQENILLDADTIVTLNAL